MALLDSFIADVRYALRMLKRSPGFTAVSIITLALGIGANTAMFSAVQGVVLAPLPFPEPDRLVMVWENNPRFPRVYVSYPNFLDWRRSAGSFQQMAAFREKGVDLTSSGAAEHVNGNEISSGFFNTLGAELTVGREFTAEEDRQGATPAAMISNRLWRNRFDSDPQALGKSITLDGVDYTIVGVAGTGYRLGTDQVDVYTPLGHGDPLVINDRASHDGILAIGRLGPGATIAQGQAEMSTLQNGLDQLYPAANKDLGIFVEPLKQVLVGEVRGTLLLLLGAVGLVLLIACSNVANLLLARSSARAREFAVRSAIGASRGRLIRQLLTESILLSLAGAGLGLLIATFGLRAVTARVTGILPRIESIGVNGPVLLFTLAVSIVVGVGFGLAPALKNWTADLQASIKEAGRGSTSGRHRVQSALVIVQVALTLVLLVGAGLMLRTIRRLWNVNPGFDTQQIMTFKVGVSASLTKTAESTRTAYRQLIERIRAVPGVQAADFSATIPLTGQGWIMPFWINSQKPDSLQAAPRLVMYLTGPEYPRTMGIPLLRGRFFTKEDTTRSPLVMVIDSDLAKTYFPNSDPLGQTITAGFSPPGPCRIIGVVGHVRQWGLDDPSVQNQAYFPLYQDPDQWVANNYPGAWVVVRSQLEYAALMRGIKEAVYGMSAEQPIYDVQSIRQIVSQSMSSQRFPMVLLGAFAALALILAAIGVYGVVSYSVNERTREIGIRIALGAERRNIFRLVVGQGLRLILAGLAIGTAGTLILAPLLPSFSHLLYGVRPYDPLTVLAVSALLSGIAVLACSIPARRSTKVDPMEALRHD